MKRNVIKVICSLLALELFFGQSMSFISANNSALNDTEIVETNLDNQETTEEKMDVKSNVSVYLMNTLGLNSAVPFEVSLNGEVQEGYLDTSSSLRGFEFKDIPQGTYELKISAPGFVTYTQNIEVSIYDLKLIVSTGEVNEDAYGVMLYGDVNADGSVDLNDTNAIIDAIESKSVLSQYDLNTDGNVDLIDLQYASAKVGSKQREALIEKELNKDAIIFFFFYENTIIEKVENGYQVKAANDEVVSEDNPITFSMELGNDETVLVDTVTVTTGINKIGSGTITVEYVEDGIVKTIDLPIVSALLRSVSADACAMLQPDGSIVVNLGGQIAVKRIKFTITGTTEADAKLVEISDIEFVNSMDEKIPAPELNIPNIKSVAAGNASIDVSWEKERNVTGYEVSITHDNQTQYISTTDTSIRITMFLNKKLENKKEYTIAVRSVNGDWRSDFSEAYTVIPKATEKPDKPDALKLTGVFQGIKASWKAPKDNATDYYTLYYKKRSDTEFTKISNIQATDYTIQNLQEDVEYVVYVTASNEYGESEASTQASGKTASTRAIEFSNYRLINTSNGSGKVTNHIVSAIRRKGIEMVNSPLDEGNDTSSFGLVDNDQNSYYQLYDWDDAVNYHTADEGWGLTFELDKTYTMDTINFSSPDNNMDFNEAAIYYWENGQRIRVKDLSLTKKTDENGNHYYSVKLANPITTDKIKLGVSRSSRLILISEVKFYEYDSLEDDIENIYIDDFHLSIRKDVTEEDLDLLQTRLDTTNQGDYHPDKDALQKELDEARRLFNEQSLLNEVQYVKSTISSSYDTQLNTGGLNAWQPLGISAKAGEQIIIYVGKEGVKKGNANLKLVATQQHANAGEVSKEIADLKIGRNVITIPELTSEDVEKGGALYIRYTGNNVNEQYAYRVNGGHKIPVLDLYNVSEEEKQSRIETYVQELKTYVASLEEEHNNDHATQILFFTLNGYDEEECIYNTTDIMLDNMMLSLPASQVLAGIQSNPEEILNATVDSMNEMMILFYQSKGLTNNFVEGTSDSVKNTNHLPSQHLNIRYMKMFSGAFMYASSNHIGIEWNETKGLMVNQKPTVSENGQLTQGQYFGWGIAHEIGHQLNQQQYTIPEVTNNYYSLLAQANGSNNSVRFDYNDVYKKVTSNTKGYPSDVFTQLAMYWQLRLAYDDHYAQKTFNDYDEIFNNLLYARIDSYARNTSLFDGEIPLTLTSDVDQNFMRLASAAANKDLTEFFTRWGYTPNEDTKTFMGQFDKETRAIYYINDDAKSSMIENTAQSFLSENVIENIDVNIVESDVQLTIQSNEAYSDDILGYEIVRVTKNKSKVQKKVIGFTTSATFTDSVTLGSRVVGYEVYAVDKYTNYSNAYSTDNYKVTSDGVFDKTQMTVSTNMISEMDTQTSADENTPCSPVKTAAINMVLDGNKTENYIGRTNGNEDPYVLIDLKETLEVSGVRYYAGNSPISDYKIEVSKDDSEYVTVRNGEFILENNQQAVYFTNNTDPWVATYEARYIKITALNGKKQDIGIAEFDILGPTGDNIEFYQDNGTPAIGKLASDFIYQEKNDVQEELKIPEGSIIFTGKYKGNPAYNVVVLYDENGNIVGGTNSDGELISQQIILAQEPGDALLGETSEGVWIYWIKPEDQIQLPRQVRAELYRVDNAQTNAGERLVSDTLLIDVPSELPLITLTK